ncbi:aminotransferase class V-fold PLP-dependent enzyme [Marinomonas sp. IMCC 4694]|uniref:aminotransferase class V-fold PLP-dependent enzyme n=1 Tax=Marinomonas sp. IMCC 4694 TaxID=2605432 RepID=UPI0011E75318|nr:SufS family cysteine desulfurase [Marinomonas sp. IMCC 4694]TYL47296.1 SufS family cysteine desulfurase [Marinomonas sp. IMCC 4694]
MTFDVAAIREQFPILKREIDGKPLIYFDNAATTQKPQCVIDALVDYYSTCNSNVHRGAHRLADEATRRFEDARDIVKTFINAPKREEVIWTTGSTEGINIVANGLRSMLSPGDEVITTGMDHHANLVTWQQACKASGAILKTVPVTDDGELDQDAYEALLSDKTKFVAFPHVSNALGTINPVKDMTAKAKQCGALVLVDGAQGAAHGWADVQDIGCDFYVFSGHKLYGPMGVGVLWGRESVLENWPVWRVGGEMISTVTLQDATWNVLPYRFEAGTPNVGGVIALGEAIRWFSALDHDAVIAHEKALLAHATALATEFDGLTIIGTAKDKIGVLSFVLDHGHPADVGFLLDRQGIAVRTGDHCAQPLMARFNVPGTARASFAVYNTLEEVDALFVALKKVRTMLA